MLALCDFVQVVRKTPLKGGLHLHTHTLCRGVGGVCATLEVR